MTSRGCSTWTSSPTGCRRPDVNPGGLTAYVLIAILSVAMGLRNTIARGIGDPNLATTVLNLTLSAFVSATPTGIASESERSVDRPYTGAAASSRSISNR